MKRTALFIIIYDNRVTAKHFTHTSFFVPTNIKFYPPVQLADVGLICYDPCHFNVSTAVIKVPDQIIIYNTLLQICCNRTLSRRRIKEESPISFSTDNVRMNIPNKCYQHIDLAEAIDHLASC